MNKVYQYGTIKLTKWVKKNNDKDFVNFSIEGSYLDDNNDWQKSNSYTKEQLMRLKLLIDKAISEDIVERDF